MKLSGDDDVRYYAYVEDTAGGPYTIEGLESLVYLKKITPDTFIAREGAEAYTLLRDSELQPILFPGLLSQEDSNPDVWTPPGQENDPAQINRKRFRTTTAKFENVNARAGNLPRIDVHDILHEIRVAEKESGLDLPRSSRFRLSKRGLDFWIMAIAGNAVIIGVCIAMQNTMSMVFGIGCSAMYTFGLLWSMYGVMDRY
jgi:hypothetical protein